jgi:lantibiotic modifying enzyme
MLGALDDLEFSPARATPIVRLCGAGARSGWQEFEAAANPDLSTSVCPRAKASLRRDLRRRLERLSRRCLELERTSFELALNSIGLAASSDPTVIERMFLGDKPSHRLFSLFKKFPVLARLWRLSISQWRDHVTEVLLRFREDRASLARALFGNKPIGPITNFRCNLSDPHNQGRTVTELQFSTGAVIYKPRSGDGEWEWASLLEWMNAQSFQPRLRPARVLRRKGYCWMERIAAAPCKNAAGARRFYERMGGLIAAAYLLKAVDCHRDNLIASGEDPVLVDADALWHVAPITKTQSPLDLLYSTGFFPSANPRSLQSRSSALGPGTAGKHVPRLAGQPLQSGQYRREIARGFARAWRCILGTRKARETFARQLRRIRATERRWIYWATESYGAIRDASFQPQALLSGRERELLIRRQCTRGLAAPDVIDAEIRALKQLDIPYFLRRTSQSLTPDRLTVPPELIQALRSAGADWR